MGSAVWSLPKHCPSSRNAHLHACTRRRFNEARSRADIDQLMQEWLDAVKTGSMAEINKRGWPGTMYGE